MHGEAGEAGSVAVQEHRVLDRCTAGRCLYMGVGGLSIATALYLVLCRSIGGRSLWRRHGGSYWRQG